MGARHQKRIMKVK